MKQGKFGGPIDYFPTQTPQWKQKSLLRKQKPTILEKGKIAGDVITSGCPKYIVIVKVIAKKRASRDTLANNRKKIQQAVANN